MPHVAVAQVPIPDVPRIRLGENRLDFPGSRERFDSLLCCLHDSNAHLNILHIGGSHVQAGTFPHRLRENIGAARGMLFPWKTIRSNAPADYSLTSSGSWEKSRCLEPSPTEQLGMSGAAAITTDADASLQLMLPAQYAFRRLHVIGKAEGGAEPYLVSSWGDTLTAEQNDDDFLFTLDSPDSLCTIAFRGMAGGFAANCCPPSSRCSARPTSSSSA